MPYSLDLTDQQINLIINKYRGHEIPYINDYTLFRGKIKNNTLTIYTTGKMLIQGKTENELAIEIHKLIDLPIPDELLINKDENKNNDLSQIKLNIGEDEIGSDEVGTGDFFGGIFVCSCFLSKDNILFVKHAGVKDSKQLNDEKIRLIAKQLIKRLQFEISFISPSKYNEITNNNTDMNLNKIKAIMHNAAILKIVKKSGCKKVILDDFCTKQKYFEYLGNKKDVYKNIIFEEKAENKYLSVACASIIARFYFLEYFDKMKLEAGYDFLKGASQKVDALAAQILKEKGELFLSNYAKLNYKNLKKARRILNKQNNIVFY